MPLHERHIALWLGTNDHDLALVNRAGDKPALAIRVTLAGSWPNRIKGCAIVPIFDLVGGTTTDHAVDAVVSWLTAAARTSGTCGRTLAKVMTTSGFPLWWAVDISLAEMLRLRLTAIDALFAVLDRLAPRRITIVGEDQNHPWLRETVHAVAKRWAEEHDAAVVVQLGSAPTAASPSRAERMAQELKARAVARAIRFLGAQRFYQLTSLVRRTTNVPQRAWTIAKKCAAGLQPSSHQTPPRFLLKAPPQPQHPAPPCLTREPQSSDILVLSWGWELRWYLANGQPAIEDPFIEGMLVALSTHGLKASYMSLGTVYPGTRTGLAGGDKIPELQQWRRNSFSYQEAVEELLKEWRAWRGTSASRQRFPDYRGIAMDETVVNLIERVLPDLATRILDAVALSEYLRRHAPAAVVFSHLASSQRHLIAPIRAANARAIAPTIGIDVHALLFYGLAMPDSGCPQADAYLLWGPRQAKALAAKCPHVRAFSPGRTRQDAFVRYGGQMPQADWLQKFGMPSGVRRVIVFGDVLRSTNKANILTSATWVGVVQAMLAAVADQRDVHVVVKPWRGDSLREVLTLVEQIADRRLHVMDPETVPYHNAQLLQHAVTVVSSPTSFLAEFAAMGRQPVLLSLPETHYYYGTRLHEIYGKFCHVTRSIADVKTAIQTLIRDPDRLEPSAEIRQRALAEYFGPGDGHNSDRFAEVVRTLVN